MKKLITFVYVNGKFSYASSSMDMARRLIQESGGDGIPDLRAVTYDEFKAIVAGTETPVEAVWENAFPQP